MDTEKWRVFDKDETFSCAEPLDYVNGNKIRQQACNFAIVHWN
jgi:hypothetical protein